MARSFLTALGRAVLNHKGYPRLWSGPHRGKYLHRAVFETVAGRPVKPGFHIHHQGPRLCWCPHNLIEMPACFNPSRQIRDVYTGEFLSVEQWVRRYGHS